MNRTWQELPIKHDQFRRFINWLSTKFTTSLLCSGKGWTPNEVAGFGCHKSTNQYTGTLIERLHHLLNDHEDWVFGHFGYNLKSETALVTTGFPDEDGFSDLFFFVPEIVVIPGQSTVKIGCINLELFVEVTGWLENIADKFPSHQDEIHLTAATSRSDYLQRFAALKKHIRRGYIYEINYCIDFSADSVAIEPPVIFERLQSLSEAPFAALYRNNSSWLICASPERFLLRKNSKLISQPIKGTRRRSADALEDAELKAALAQDGKERSENIMIVDLVRNDLSRVAKRGSVRVTELCGVHTFKTVHQMISTVECELRDEVTIAEIIRATFPMGSMTGAPKISAMQLAEKFEQQSRGIYSGSVGFITPEKDFDFNVVIRSITWNQSTGHISAKAGSAITANADAAKEYEECLLKAEAMMNALKRV